MSAPQHEHVSLCEALDRLLDKGVVVQGDLVVRVADVDLIYLGLRVLLASVDTLRRETSRSNPAHAGSAEVARP